MGRNKLPPSKPQPQSIYHVRKRIPRKNRRSEIFPKESSMGMKIVAANNVLILKPHSPVLSFNVDSPMTPMVVPPNTQGYKQKPNERIDNTERVMEWLHHQTNFAYLPHYDVESFWNNPTETVNMANTIVSSVGGDGLIVNERLNTLGLEEDLVRQFREETEQGIQGWFTLETDSMDIYVDDLPCFHEES